MLLALLILALLPLGRSSRVFSAAPGAGGLGDAEEESCDNVNIHTSLTHCFSEGREEGGCTSSGEEVALGVCLFEENLGISMELATELYEVEGEMTVEVTLECPQYSETQEFTLVSEETSFQWFNYTNKSDRTVCSISIKSTGQGAIHYLILNVERVETRKFRDDTHAADLQLSKVIYSRDGTYSFFASRVYKWYTELYPIIYLRVPGIVSHQADYYKDVYIFKGAIPATITSSFLDSPNNYYGNIKLKSWSRSISPYFINGIDPIFADSNDEEEYVDIFGVLICLENKRVSIEQNTMCTLSSKCADIKGLIMPYSISDITKYRILSGPMLNRTNETSGEPGTQIIDQYFQYGFERFSDKNLASANTVVINCFVPCSEGSSESDKGNNCDSKTINLIQASGDIKPGDILVEFGGGSSLVNGYNTPDSAITNVEKYVCYNTKFSLVDAFASQDPCIINEDIKDKNCEEDSSDNKKMPCCPSRPDKPVSHINFFGTHKTTLTGDFNGALKFFSYLSSHVSEIRYTSATNFATEGNFAEFIVILSSEKENEIEGLGVNEWEHTDRKEQSEATGKGLFVVDIILYKDESSNADKNVPTSTIYTCETASFQSDYHMPCSDKNLSTHAGFILVESERSFTIDIFYEPPNSQVQSQEKSEEEIRIFYAAYLPYVILSVNKPRVLMVPSQYKTVVYKEQDNSQNTNKCGIEIVGFALTYVRGSGEACISVSNYTDLSEICSSVYGTSLEESDCQGPEICFNGEAAIDNSDYTSIIKFDNIPGSQLKSYEVNYAIYVKTNNHGDGSTPLYCVDLVAESEQGELRTLGPYVANGTLGLELGAPGQMLQGRLHFRKPEFYDPNKCKWVSGPEHLVEENLAVYQFDDALSFHRNSCRFQTQEAILSKGAIKEGTLQCDEGGMCACDVELHLGYSRLALLVRDAAGMTLLYDDLDYREPQPSNWVILITILVPLGVVGVIVGLVLWRRHTRKKALALMKDAGAVVDTQLASILSSSDYSQSFSTSQEM